MEIINPTITVQNTDTNHYLVRYQHDYGDGERIDIQVKIPRSNHTLGDIHRQVMERLKFLVEAITPK